MILKQVIDLLPNDIVVWDKRICIVEVKCGKYAVLMDGDRKRYYPSNKEKVRYLGTGRITTTIELIDSSEESHPEIQTNKTY